MKSESVILYIEDNKASRDLLQLLITRRENCRLICAENGTEGLDKAEEIVPDLIFLDLSLPDMSGYDVIETLKETEGTKKIPIVLLSGDIPSAPPSGKKPAFDKYLPKPVELASFYATLDSFLK